MEVLVTVSNTQKVEMPEDAILSYAIEVIRKTAGIEKCWISADGMLTHEVHTSHAWDEKNGPASDFQKESDKLANSLKKYASGLLEKKWADKRVM